MPETVKQKDESAHKVTESPEPSLRHERLYDLLEIVEATLLALVAVVIAWSGYQSAVWGSERLKLYGESSKVRITAGNLSTVGNQERLYDSLTFTAWLNAALRGDQKAAQFFERRFRDEYRPAFTAWMKTDPFNNPQAPGGPGFMSEYRIGKSEQAVALEREASGIFDRGTAAASISDRYVRATVLLATVLLFTAIGQKFHNTSVRVGLLVAAIMLLIIPVLGLLSLPRL